MQKALFLEVQTDQPAEVLKILIDAGYLVKVRRWSEDIGELAKTLVRPLIIGSSWAALLLMWVNQIPVPPILAGIGAAITGEYGLERIVKRWKEM